MLRPVARTLVSVPAIGVPLALGAKLAGRRYLSHRIRALTGEQVPDVISEPFLGTEIKMLGLGGRDMVARRLWRHGWKHFEAPLPQVIVSLARNSRCFVDVGANTGYYSMLVGLTNRHCDIYAFEPVPDIAELIARNASLNFVSIAVQQVGLGEQTGSFHLYLPVDDHGCIESSASLNPQFRAAHSGSIKVEVKRLDELGLRPDLMKIDVEGFEQAVISGAKETIRAHRPIITVEVLSDCPELAALCDELKYVPIALHLDRIEACRGLTPVAGAPNQLLWPEERPLPSGFPL